MLLESCDAGLEARSRRRPIRTTSSDLGEEALRLPGELGKDERTHRGSGVRAWIGRRVPREGEHEQQGASGAGDACGLGDRHPGRWLPDGARFQMP